MSSSSNNFKIKVDKLDVDKLQPVLADLKKLSDVVDKEVVKKDVYDELVKNVNDIKTNELAKKPDYNAKVSKIKGKTSSITGLAVNAVENKIPSVIDLVQTIDYDTKILEIEGKYFTTFNYNRIIESNN